MMREGGRTEGERIAFALRHALQRQPSADELGRLEQLYRQHLKQHEANPSETRALLGVGDARPPENLAPAQLAAWTSVARVVLNLHETITRE